MNCESAREQLIDLWREALDADARTELERHLAECPGCRDERVELEAMWARLGALDDHRIEPIPSQELRGRFYRELAGYLAGSQAGSQAESSERPGRPSLWRRFAESLRLAGAPGPQPAWLAATLVLGIALGASVMWAVGARNEVQRLSAEVELMNRSVSLALLDHQSASERLRGVTLSSRSLADERMAVGDRIVEALLDSVRNDPNVNVRLAALETLALHTDSPRVRAGLIESLPRQESPMLQVALVEVINQQNGGAKVAIQELLDSKHLAEDVRQQILSLLESV